MLTSDILISDITSIVVNQNVSTPFVNLIKSSIEIIELDNVKYPNKIFSKDSICRELTEIDSNSTFSNKKQKTKQKQENNEYFNYVNFHMFF